MHFELSDRTSATRLARRLGNAWAAALVFVDPYVVAAQVGVKPNDLTALLREVEAWVEEESICAIRFILDDRVYVLEAGTADWARHPWVEGRDESSQQSLTG